MKIKDLRGLEGDEQAYCRGVSSQLVRKHAGRLLRKKSRSPPGIYAEELGQSMTTPDGGPSRHLHKDAEIEFKLATDAFLLWNNGLQLT